MPAADRPKRSKVQHQPYDRAEYGECPTRATSQSRYFDASPSANHPSPISNAAYPGSATPLVYPKPITSLLFSPDKWLTAPRPKNIDDTQVSIRTQNALIKRSGAVLRDLCLGKYCWQTTSWGPRGDILCHEDANGRICDHTLAEWLTGCSDWPSRFEIRATPEMGYGLFSKVSWRAGEILGLYLGELVPDKTPQSNYVHSVHIGPKFAKQDTGLVAYIDAEEVGTFTRFANHACAFNALIEEARVGDERVLAMRVRRDINAGEEVCIDYGDEYFGEGKWCCCGTEECRYKENKAWVG
ncbi:SET domain-containing protein [Karstenula rhodostoma CBS 690.94]|uniref:SET domain-containing protein n=1 Tax=Karstenula rhodostoma CBS 690.94 TaxID=1392251 RepID=A0A9P4PXX0_9PLEO|nr:SET domain-containing protein [Karstenula rhodostoma CBS 690.94]